MFAGKTIWEILQIGGFTMYILLFCSFLSVAVFLERIIYYRKRSKTKRAEFMTRTARALKSGDIKMVMEICKETSTPFSNVVYSGLKLHGHPEKEISNAMEREITIETRKIGTIYKYRWNHREHSCLYRAFRDGSGDHQGIS